jgi:hypothetical protein
MTTIMPTRQRMYHSQPVKGYKTILWRTLHDIQEPHAKHASFDTLAKLTYLGAAG